MPDDKMKKDDKATSTNDAAKKAEGVKDQPISDVDAQAISGGLASVKWDKK